MANLKEIKSRINSVVSTQQITKAMKMVSAAKLRRAQDSIIQMRPYADKLSAILGKVSSGLSEDSDVSSPYAEERVVENVLLIVISSDKGLCGSFNTNVIRTASNHIEENYSEQLKQGKVTILPIGKRANDHFRKRGFNVESQFAEIFLDLSFAAVRDAAEFAMKGFVDGKYDKVEIAYNEFKNVATQVLRVEQLLPLVPSEKKEDEEMSNIEYIFEPDESYIITELIPKSLKIQLYKAVLESNASEHGARMTAMDKATDNAGELLKDLRLTYNRSRQAAITTEILEIVSGAEALGK
ncbi:ATP synthase F1 subunit gamma [Marinigracilibium pacificum]|uniref:ATP synthase gamma chain n=1 Tax=Marinigracilibium pacificum TaxID=2729599 RepID=A0A848IV50_9BACT|nr:ATP synthase F1 subunit gamma [Marinigracilibium pacificum]NMM47165.1 ATP synthase F1 subunit gamma [Marinigracilibium pacificum]